MVWRAGAGVSCGAPGRGCCHVSLRASQLFPSGLRGEGAGPDGHSLGDSGRDPGGPCPLGCYSRLLGPEPAGRGCGGAAVGSRSAGGGLSYPARRAGGVEEPSRPGVEHAPCGRSVSGRFVGLLSAAGWRGAWAGRERQASVGRGRAGRGGSRVRLTQWRSGAGKRLTKDRVTLDRKKGRGYAGRRLTRSGLSRRNRRRRVRGTRRVPSTGISPTPTPPSSSHRRRGNGSTAEQGQSGVKDGILEPKEYEYSHLVHYS